MSGGGGGGGGGAGAVGTATTMELDKQLNLWERRVKGLRRMLLGWDQTKPPEAPVSVFVEVIDATTVSVKVHETTEGPMGTKFKGNKLKSIPSCFCFVLQKCFSLHYSSVDQRETAAMAIDN